MKSNNRNIESTWSKCFEAFNVQNVRIIEYAFQLVQHGLDESISPAAKWDFGLYDFGSYRKPAIKSFNFDIADAKCVSIPNFENKASNFIVEVQWLNKCSFRRLEVEREWGKNMNNPQLWTKTLIILVMNTRYLNGLLNYSFYLFPGRSSSHVDCVA